MTEAHRDGADPSDASERQGAPRYRSFVGPAEQYQMMGATQFMLAVTMGLKPHHRLLDVGCGSLRAGRFLMAYLEPENYYGIEPNTWLVDDAFRLEVGHQLREMRRPQFADNHDFDATGFGVDFDMILAQSVFSHTGRDMLTAGLESLRVSLAPGGLMLATFKIDQFDEDFLGWKYPGGVRYTEATLCRLIESTGLCFRKLPWFHPRQTWFALALDHRQIPSAEKYDRYLSGAILRSPELETAVQRPAWLDSD